MTIAAQIKEVEREIGLRQNVYPALVRQRRMSQAKADEHLARMREVLETLKGIQYYDAITEGCVRLELRGMKQGRLQGLVKILTDTPRAHNDTLIITFARECAIDFCKAWLK